MGKKQSIPYGQRFGRLTVGELTDRTDKNGAKKYRCRCDCGNEIYVVGASLTRTRRPTRSCGCIKNGKTKPGDRYGKLTVVKQSGVKLIGKAQAHQTQWLCQCDCGNQIVVTGHQLRTGGTRSCGCVLKPSIRELHQDGTADFKLTKTKNKNNTTGVTGVWYSKSKKKYIAEIYFRGKKTTLGEYDDIKHAASARRRAENEIFGPYLEQKSEEFPEIENIQLTDREKSRRSRFAKTMEESRMESRILEILAQETQTDDDIREAENLRQRLCYFSAVRKRKNKLLREHFASQKSEGNG